MNPTELQTPPDAQEIPAKIKRAAAKKKDKRSYILSLNANPSPRARSTVRKRGHVSVSFHNNMVKECRRRGMEMKRSREWAAAIAMPKDTKCDTVGKKEMGPRAKAFLAVKKRFGLSELRDLDPFIRDQRSKFCGDHLHSHVAQYIAERVLVSTQQWLYGKRGVPKRRKRHETRAVGSRGSGQGLHWDGDVVYYPSRRGEKPLKIDVVVDRDDPVVAHALKHDHTGTSLVHKVIRGKDRYFAQVVIKGAPLAKPQHNIGTGRVGIDLGVSAIAIVADGGWAKKVEFCKELTENSRQIRRLQRRLDRQQRANNPHCFDVNGVWIKGKRMSKRTIAMKHTRMQLAELQRKEHEHRKNLHGKLIHEILSHGNDIYIERLTYRSWQRGRYGRQVRRNAPGAFIAMLKNQRAKSGIKVTEINTYKTALSQTCPNCGERKKKELGDRVHACHCGCTGDRDLISALSAMYVVDDVLDLSQSREAWLRLCNDVQAESSRWNEHRNRKRNASGCVHRNVRQREIAV